MITKLISIYQKLFWSDEKYARSVGVKIGKNCAIATRNFGSEPYLIELGNHVQVTSDVKFFTHGAAWVLREKYPDIDFFGKIKVGDNVYIGNNSLILPGVIIGDNVVVAAGSVVTKSFSSNLVIAGNPARIVKDIEAFERDMLKFDLLTKNKSIEAKKSILLDADESKFISK